MGFLSSIGDIFDPVSAVINQVAGPFGSVLGFMGQERTNDANTAQSAQQMAFQREMSDTSYQRAVKDMRAAGLNPMLAYSQGGASTPGGAKADIGNSVAAGAQSAQAFAQLQNTKADTVQKEAAANLSTAQATKTESETLPYHLNYDKAAEEVNKLMADSDLSRERKLEVQEAIRKSAAERRLIEVHTGNATLDGQILDLQKQMLSAKAPNEIGFEKSAAGAAAPYMKEFAGPVTSAAGAFVGARAGRGATGRWSSTKGSASPSDRRGKGGIFNSKGK